MPGNVRVKPGNTFNVNLNDAKSKQNNNFLFHFIHRLQIDIVPGVKTLYSSPGSNVQNIYPASSKIFPIFHPKHSCPTRTSAQNIHEYIHTMNYSAHPTIYLRHRQSIFTETIFKGNLQVAHL